MAKKIMIENAQYQRIFKGGKEPLLEMARDNLTFREFKADMRRMGFVYREAAGSSRVFYIPQYGDISNIVIHAHNENVPIDGNALRQVKNVLESIGWFKDPSNFNIFPFEKWQLSSTDVSVDTTQQEIERANEEYKGAEVRPVFAEKNTICVLKVGDKYNLCRSINDRRPILTDWYDEYAYDRKTQSRLCLKRNNWDTMETEAYPITQDGLDMENVIIENKRYEKSRIK